MMTIYVTLFQNSEKIIFVRHAIHIRAMKKYMTMSENVHLQSHVLLYASSFLKEKSPLKLFMRIKKKSKSVTENLMKNFLRYYLTQGIIF